MLHTAYGFAYAVAFWGSVYFDWIEDVANRIEIEAQNLIATDPVKAQKMIDIANMIKNPANATKIKPYVVTLNRPVGGAAGTGSMNILKLNPFK